MKLIATEAEVRAAGWNVVTEAYRPTEATMMLRAVEQLHRDGIPFCFVERFGGVEVWREGGVCCETGSAVWKAPQDEPEEEPAMSRPANDCDGVAGYPEATVKA